MCNGVGSVTGAQIDQAASELGIPCAVVLAQITLESGGNPNALSPAGAEGVAQFLPSTWAGEGCSGSPNNVDDAMACYVKFMGSLLKQFNNSILDALAAYNAGANNIGAGMGYANEILSSAGQSTSAKGTGSSGGSSSDTSTDSGATSGGTGILGDIESLLGLGAATSFATDLGKLVGGLMWIVTPGAWLRIGAFFFAIVLLIGAIIIFTHADEKIMNTPIPIPVPV